MYPRLYIARELLKDDGVIFISIDDNEQAQLKLLCDEVFGEENFVAEIIRNTNSSKNQSLFVSVSHEYCLIYAKDIISLSQKHQDDKWGVEKNNIKEYLSKVTKLKKLGLSEEEITAELKELTNYPRFIDFTNYWYFDENGLYAKDNLGGITNGNMTPIINPLTKTTDPIPPGGFRFNSEKLAQLIKENRIHFHTDGSLPRLKRYLSENLTQRPKSIMSDDQRPDYALLQKFGIPFDNPKQMNFMTRILSIFDKNSIILDFFAGSGTTAHAVMQLNAEDKGNRQFIMVQLPETTDPKSEAHKAGYQTIFDITQARIEKAAAKIQADNPDYQGDLGFKIFETVEDFRTLPEFNSDSQQAALLFPDLAHLDDEQIQTLITTWRVYDGQKLPENIHPINLGGYTAYLCDKHLYLLHNDFASAHIKALLDKLDEDKTFVIERIVLLGDAIDSAKQQELNQAIKTYANKKSLNISVLVRY